MKQITSLSNPKFKELKKFILDPRKQKKENFFFVEGKREIEMALKGGYEPLGLFFCEFLEENKFLFEKFSNSTSFDFKLFSKLIYRENKSNLLGLFKRRQPSIFNIQLPKTPCIWIIENVEKPGNLGAILRSAEVLGVDAVGLCNEKIDFFHPHVIRTSLGAVFITSIFCETSQNIFSWLKEKKIKLFVSALQANSKNIYEVNFKSPCAMVVGSEDRGVSDFWIKNADTLIKIPMNGKINSLNVSVATALMGAEIMRQRKFDSE